MAYDKVVDSAKLNSAITASADAIRAKTGGTAKIQWDENTGFSAAITTQNKSVTPKASSQTIKPDAGYIGLGQVTVNGDSDLKAANIAKGVNIFGVTGTLESGSKVAIGEFTRSNGQHVIYDNPVTISGLGFKPSRVIVFLVLNTGARVYYCWDRDILVSLDSINNASVVTAGEYDEDYEDYDNHIRGEGSVEIAFTNDGFTISSDAYLYFDAGRPYRYIAIG